MEQDFYEILNVAPDAEGVEIKTAYRNLALQHHPDRNENNPEAAEKMKNINEAYAVLSNPEKRREYDQLRSQFGSSAYQHFRQTYTERDIFSGSDINTILEELAKSFGIRGFDELFKEIYGQGYQSFNLKRPGFSARGFVFTGPFRQNRNPGRERIDSGSNPFLSKMARYAFKKVSGMDLPETGADDHDVIYVPPEQMRGGGPFAYLNRRNGKKIVVQIPPNIKERQRIRLKGMGKEGRGGGSPGDLFLQVREKKEFPALIQDFARQAQMAFKKYWERAKIAVRKFME